MLASFYMLASQFMWGVSLTHLVLASLGGSVFCFLCFLHVPCWLVHVGSFSYTSSAGFFVWGVSIPHPVLASLCGEFLLHILCWLLCVGSFFLHILCWLLCLGSFSYTSYAGRFMWGISLTFPC